MTPTQVNDIITNRLAEIAADFRREEKLYCERRDMDNISSDMRNILQFLYGRLAEALEVLSKDERK